MEGTPVSFNDGDHFGFEAKRIDFVQIGGIVIPLSATSTDNITLGSTGDVRLREDLAPVF